MSLLVDHLKNSLSFSSICPYEHFLKFSLGLLGQFFSFPSSISSELFLFLYIFLQTLNCTGLSLVSVCLSSQSLFFLWLYPWKVSRTTLALLLSICTWFPDWNQTFWCFELQIYILFIIKCSFSCGYNMLVPWRISCSS